MAANFHSTQEVSVKGLVEIDVQDQRNNTGQ